MTRKHFWTLSVGMLTALSIIASAEAQTQRKPGAAGDGPSPEMREQMLKRFDTNGNGQLDPDERQAAQAAREKMQAQGGRPGTPGAAGAGGRPNAASNGAPSAEMREQMLKRFDTNGNGKLDPDEMQAAQAAREKMQAQGGRPGAGGTRPAAGGARPAAGGTRPTAAGGTRPAAGGARPQRPNKTNNN